MAEITAPAGYTLDAPSGAVTPPPGYQLDGAAPAKPAPAEEPSQMRDLFSHAWDQFSGAVTGTIAALHHPIDTLSAEKQRSAELLSKAADAWKKGDKGAALDFTAEAVPVLGALNKQTQQEFMKGRYGAGFGDLLGFFGTAKLGSKLVESAPGLARGAAEVVKDPGTAVGNLARAVPEVVTEKVLPKVESAATLKPATQDAVKMLPGGSQVVAGANTLARTARTASKVIKKAQGIGVDEPTPARVAPGVPYPGGQDPAAVQPRTPVIDTSTELPGRTRTAPTDEAAPVTREAPYPGQQDPASIEPRTPQFDTSTELTPERLQELEARRAAETIPPAGETKPAIAETPRTGKFGLKPGEGTHLELDLKEGEVPAAKDYQAAARKVWAGHMATRLKAMNVSADDFGQMTQGEVDALAKEIGIKASSPEKIALVLDKLQSQPNVALPSLGKATEYSAKPVQAAPSTPSTKRKPRPRPKSIAETVGDQLMEN